MSTSNSSSLAVPRKYSDQFEELYSKTLLISPSAKFFLEELSSGAKKSSSKNDKQAMGQAGNSKLLKAPVSKGRRPLVHQSFLSPAAKIIQQMKTKVGQDNNGKEQQGKENGQVETRSKQNSLGKKNSSAINIPRFECSDASSESSSDLDDDDDEQHIAETNTNTAQNRDKKHNLHSLVQEYRSPEKQSAGSPSTPVVVNKSRSRTPSGEDAHKQSPLTVLKKSLTPEFCRASTDRRHSSSRSPSPVRRNSEYRNRKAAIIDESTMVRLENGKKSEVGLSKNETKEEEVIGDTPSVSKIDKQSQDVTQNKTPTTHDNVSGILQKSSSEQDDETPKITKTFKASSTKETSLDDWFIQMLPGGKGIRLQGHRVCDPPDSLWNSSVITKRVDTTTVTTKSGSIYKLVGKIDRLSTRDEGFSWRVVKRFANGFPVDWKELLSEFVHQSSDRPSNTSEGEMVKLKTPATRKHKRTNYSSKKGYSVPRKSGQELNTPQNTVSIAELPRSRSGRMIKPPLAFWRNQRLRSDVNADTIEIVAGGTNYLPQGLETTLMGSTELSQRELDRTRRKQRRELKRVKLLHCTSLPKELLLLTGQRLERESDNTGVSADSCTETETDRTQEKTRQGKLSKRKYESKKSREEDVKRRKVNNSMHSRTTRSNKSTDDLFSDDETSRGHGKKKQTSTQNETSDGDCEQSSDEEVDTAKRRQSPRPSPRKTRSKSKTSDVDDSNLSSDEEINTISLLSRPRKTRSKNQASDDDTKLSYDEAIAPQGRTRKTRPKSKPRDYGAELSCDGEIVPQGQIRKSRSKSKALHDDNAKLSYDEEGVPLDRQRKTRTKSKACVDDNAKLRNDGEMNNIAPPDRPRQTGVKRRSPPDPPRKTRSKISSNNLPDVVKSPLYYNLSPDVTSDGTDSCKEIKHPQIGTTPSEKSVQRNAPITLRSALLKQSNLVDGSADDSECGDKDTPRTAHLKCDAQKYESAVPLSDVKKRMVKPKTLGSSPFDLHREIMSVVIRHKQERLSKSKKRRSNQDVNSSCNETKGVEVYDLDNSSDEFEDIHQSQTRGVSRQSQSKETQHMKSKKGESSDSDFTVLLKSKSTSQNGKMDEKSVVSIEKNNNCENRLRTRTRISYNGKNKVEASRTSKRIASQQYEEITIIDSDSSEDSDSNADESLSNSCNAKSKGNKRRVSFEEDPNASCKKEVANDNVGRTSMRRSKKNAVLKMKEISVSDSSGTEMMSLSSKKVSQNRSKRASAKINEKSTKDEDYDSLPATRVTKKATRKVGNRGKGNKTKKPTSSDTAQEGASAPLQDATSKENKNANIKKTAESSENEWSTLELDKLKKALEVVAPDSNRYWDQVASIVRTKSAEVCQLKHQQRLENQISRPKTAKKPTEKKAPTEPVQLTAKKGTLKRKRQLRELVEQHNQGAEADYFDSTPFKQRSKKIKISANLDSDDEDDFGEPGKTPGSVRFKTPSVRPHGLAPLSDKKTPHTNLLSPLTQGVVNRNYIDGYINHIQKKKKRGRTLAQTTPFIKKKIRKVKNSTDMDVAVNKANASGLFDVKPASDRSDSEADSDYYWSDQEQ